MKTCEYQNDGKRITQPGKFEGEPIFTPFFWEQGLNGFADKDDGTLFTFKITKKDREEWPLLNEWLGRKRTIRLWEDSQGFVRCV